MRKNGMWGMLAAVALMAATGDAYAVTVDCTMGAGNLAAQFTTGGQPGTIYQFTGPCTGNFDVSADAVTIEPNGAVNNTINGEVQISGARFFSLTNVVIDGSTNTTDAAVSVQGPAQVMISGSTIQKSIADGIGVTGPALVHISGSTIQNSAGHGINAAESAAVEIDPTTITNNAKFGVRANHGAFVRMTTVSVTGNQQGGVNAQNGSALVVKGGSIDSSGAPNAIAVVAVQSSVGLSGVSVTGPTGNRTIAAFQSGSVFLQGSTVTADTLPGANAQLPLSVIMAVGGSSIALAGGNTISNTAAGGVAIVVADGSSLIESNGTLFGNAAALDAINGAGRIQTQSSIELAFSPTGGGVDWTGNVLMSQFSSFRSDGNNVTINGTLTLSTGANGFFNQSNWSGTGTSNSITSVVCQSTTDHVTNPTQVTPPITTGSSPPACQVF